MVCATAQLCDTFLFDISRNLRTKGTDFNSYINFFRNDEKEKRNEKTFS